MQKSNWKKCKLKDLVKINSSSVSKKDNLEHIVYLDTGNITMGKIEELAEFAYSEAPSRAKRKVKENSIVYSMVRPNQRHYGLIKNPTTNLIVSTGFAVLDAKEFADSKYIYYWLTQNHITDLLQSIAENSTSAYPAIRPVDLENLDISLPPLEEQKRIAEILGSLDDKIELLQKQNKTLEDMAKALFKSWFVNFDVVRAKQKGLPKADIMREYHLTEELYDLFPSSFADSPLGPIPSGWEVKTIQDLGQVVCGKTPSTSHKEYYGGSVPFITIPDMHNSIFANKTERYLTSQGEQAQPTKTLPPFSVCVSCIATPGLVTMTTTNSQTNQQINSVIPHNLEAKFYNYYVLRSVADQIRAQGSGGSVFVNLNKTAFSKIKVLWADQSLQKLFTKESESYFNKILNNLKQIQTLTEVRDTLLPRLISGKIRV